MSKAPDSFENPVATPTDTPLRAPASGRERKRGRGRGRSSQRRTDSDVPGPSSATGRRVTASGPVTPPARNIREEEDLMLSLQCQLSLIAPVHHRVQLNYTDTIGVIRTFYAIVVQRVPGISSAGLSSDAFTLCCLWALARRQVHVLQKVGMGMSNRYRIPYSPRDISLPAPLARAFSAIGSVASCIGEKYVPYFNKPPEVLGTSEPEMDQLILGGYAIDWATLVRIVQAEGVSTTGAVNVATIAPTPAEARRRDLVEPAPLLQMVGATFERPINPTFAAPALGTVGLGTIIVGDVPNLQLDVQGSGLGWDPMIWSRFEAFLAILRSFCSVEPLSEEPTGTAFWLCRTEDTAQGTRRVVAAHPEVRDIDVGLACIFNLYGGPPDMFRWTRHSMWVDNRSSALVAYLSSFIRGRTNPSTNRM